MKVEELSLVLPSVLEVNSVGNVWLRGLVSAADSPRELTAMIDHFEIAIPDSVLTNLDAPLRGLSQGHIQSATGVG
jgi:hypothetical protein